MSATALRCRVCETAYPLDPIGVCTKCFGPLEPVYDRAEQRRTVTHASIEAGPRSIWRYADLLPVAPPVDQRLPAGWTPLVRAPRLEAALGLGELWLKVLCPADLEPEKLIATSIYGAKIIAVDGSYDDCSRLSVELSFELDWAFVNVGLRAYYAEGSKTLAFEIAEQLGWELPDAVIAPIASGAMFSKVHQGFNELLELGLVEGTTPRLIGGQAEGCSPVATAFADGAKVKPVRPNTIARSLAIGSPADGDLAATVARTSGGSVHAVPEDEIADNIALLAETTGIFGETAPAVTLGALRDAVANGELGETDRVVLLVTGDGLKTPGVVSDRFELTRVRPDADEILETFGVQV